jgi:hypothetical protein
MIAYFTQINNKIPFSFPWYFSPQWVSTLSLLRLRDHKHTNFGRTSVGLYWTGDCRTQEMKRNEFEWGVQHRPEAGKSHSVVINKGQKLESPIQRSSTQTRGWKVPFSCHQHRPEAGKSHSVVINTDQKLESPIQL